MRAQTGYNPVKPHDERQHRDQIGPREERKTKGTDEWQKEKRSKRHQGCREDGKRAPSWNLKHSYSLSILHRIGEHLFRMPILEVMERIEQGTESEQFWRYTLSVDCLSRERDVLSR
jgi:hypothetical protein